MSLIPSVGTTPPTPSTHTRPRETQTPEGKIASPSTRSHVRAVPSAATTPVVATPKHAAAPKHTVDVKA